MVDRGVGVGGLGSMPLGGNDSRALGDVTLTGTGTITPSYSLWLAYGATYKGAGTLGPSTILDNTTSTSLVSNGTTTPATILSNLASLTLSGSGTTSPDPALWLASGATLAGNGSLSISYILDVITSVVGGLGNGDLGSMPLGDQLPLHGSGTLTADTIIQLDEGASLAAAGTLKSDTVRERNATGTFTGTGTISQALAGFPDWRVDGTSLRELIDETRDWQELELVWRVTDKGLLASLRALDSDSGSVDVIVQSDGSFLAFDRAGGNNTYALEPPLTREPLRQDGDYYVDKYEEEVVGTQGDSFEITVTFVDDASRETTSTLNESRDVGDWLFEFETGDVATSRVKADVSSKNKSGAASKTVNLVLTPEQAKVVEESATYLESVTVHEVPDGQNFTVDESPSTRNTVEVTSPPGYAVDLTGGRVETPVFDFADGDSFAVGCWMTLPTNDSGVMIAQRDNDNFGSEGWDVTLQSDGTIEQETEDSTGSSTSTSSEVVADGEAHLVLFEYEEGAFADSQRVYVDTDAIFTGGTDFGDVFSDVISFGAYRDGSSPLATTVDKMFVLDSPTTAAEREALAAGKRVKSKELMWLPADENTGTTLNDESGNSNDGSIVGSFNWVKSPALPFGRDVLDSGTYAVEDWETEWTSNDFFTVELELTST